MGPLLTLLSNPLPTPLLTRPLKIIFIVLSASLKHVGALFVRTLVPRNNYFFPTSFCRCAALIRLSLFRRCSPTNPYLPNKIAEAQPSCIKSKIVPPLLDIEALSGSYSLVWTTQSSPVSKHFEPAIPKFNMPQIRKVQGELGWPFPPSAQQVLNPTPLNPTPATCHKRKTEVALQFSESCAAELHCNIRFSAVWTSIFTKSCAATSEKQHCNIEKSCVARKWRFPAAVLWVSSPHV